MQLARDAIGDFRVRGGEVRREKAGRLQPGGGGNDRVRQDSPMVHEKQMTAAATRVTVEPTIPYLGQGCQLPTRPRAENNLRPISVSVTTALTSSEQLSTSMNQSRLAGADQLGCQL
jgi:hypothetical protein